MLHFFAPGDTIFFKKGDTWRETLTVSSSGTSGNSIIIASYGTGDDPIITGSDLIISWSKHDTNIWKATITKQPNIAYFNNKRGTLITTHECANPYEWYWASNVLYVYAPGDTDPSATYTSPGVEVGARNAPIYLNDKSYITIDDLTVRDGNGILTSNFSANIYIGYSNCVGIVVKNCILERGVHRGITCAASVNATSITIDNCDIHDNGGHGIYINDPISSGQISYNTIYQNGWRSYIDNHQYDGIQGYLGNVNIFGNIIHDNVSGTAVSDDESHGIYALASKAVMNVYQNTIYNHQNGAGIKTRGSANIYGNMIYNNHLDGIEPGGNGAVNIVVSIYNNIIFNNGMWGVWTDTKGIGTFSLSIINNTFYKNSITSGYREIDIEDDLTALTIKNNILFAADASGRTLYADVQTGTVDIDYNLHWRTDGNPSIRYGDIYPTWAQWQTLGFDTHIETTADPLFVSTTNFQLQTTSPAIGEGVNIGLKTDYDGNAFKNPPSIGAYEYDSKPASPVLPVYQSSVVENATPSVIEMIYNLALANIVPSASAFLVHVNSVTRNISSGSVSENKSYSDPCLTGCKWRYRDCCIYKTFFQSITNTGRRTGSINKRSNCIKQSQCSGHSSCGRDASSSSCDTCASTCGCSEYPSCGCGKLHSRYLFRICRGIECQR